MNLNYRAMETVIIIYVSFYFYVNVKNNNIMYHAYTRHFVIQTDTSLPLVYY